MCERVFQPRWNVWLSKKSNHHVIEKQHKNRTLIENWRPISLINVNAKIIPKVIASRLKKVLPNIIHHNQTGYVEDRYIGETIRSIFVIMEFTDSKNIPGILIFIDFKKAFDSLEWHYLFSCLEAFNFAAIFKLDQNVLYKFSKLCNK